MQYVVRKDSKSCAAHNQSTSPSILAITLRLWKTTAKRPKIISVQPRSFSGEMKRPYIRTLQCDMRGCLQKATMRPDAILLLHSQKFDLVLGCFSLSRNPGSISLSCAAYHMESEKHAVSSPPLKLPAHNFGSDVSLHTKYKLFSYEKAEERYV